MECSQGPEEGGPERKSNRNPEHIAALETGQAPSSWPGLRSQEFLIS